MEPPIFKSNRCFYFRNFTVSEKKKFPPVDKQNTINSKIQNTIIESTLVNSWYESGDAFKCMNKNMDGYLCTKLPRSQSRLKSLAIKVKKKEKKEGYTKLSLEDYNAKINTIYKEKGCPYDRELKCNKIIKHIKKAGFAPNEFSFAPILNIWTKINNEDKALDIFKKMKSENVPCVRTYESLFNMYLRLKKWDSAENLLKELPIEKTAGSKRFLNNILFLFMQQNNDQKFNEFLKFMESSEPELAKKRNPNKKTTIIKNYQLMQTGKKTDLSFLIRKNEVHVSKMSWEITILALKMFFEKWDGQPFKLVIGKQCTLDKSKDRTEVMIKKIEEEFPNLKCTTTSAFNKLSIQQDPDYFFL